jgi:hypothetical protein
MKERTKGVRAKSSEPNSRPKIKNRRLKSMDLNDQTEELNPHFTKQLNDLKNISDQMNQLKS